MPDKLIISGEGGVLFQLVKHIHQSNFKCEIEYADTEKAEPKSPDEPTLTRIPATAKKTVLGGDGVVFTSANQAIAAIERLYKEKQSRAKEDAKSNKKSKESKGKLSRAHFSLASCDFDLEKLTRRIDITCKLGITVFLDSLKHVDTDVIARVKGRTEATAVKGHNDDVIYITLRGLSYFMAGPGNEKNTFFASRVEHLYHEYMTVCPSALVTSCHPSGQGLAIQGEEIFHALAYGPHKYRNRCRDLCRQYTPKEVVDAIVEGKSMDDLLRDA